MKDYKDTLWILKTDFDMRGNLGVRENTFQQKWKEMDLYNSVLRKNKNNEVFVLHDGPPYANGPIHVGHALNKSLKDFVIRYQTMLGKYVRYIPGWDVHGLPIETAIVKKGVNRKELTPLHYRKLCLEFALKQIDIQEEGFKRLGVLGEYENKYITSLPAFEADQIRVFAAMVEKGLIFKGLKPVFWSPSSESAFAEAEIEYEDKEDPSVFVSFDITKGLIGTKAVIWTTTPWTLPANLAISVGAKIVYVVVSVDNEKYLVAKNLLEKIKETLSWSECQIISEHLGSELEFMEYKHPLYDRISPIICGEHVTTTDGTGLVHTAPGHGEDDFNVGKLYGLPCICPVDGKGVMTEEAPRYEGMFYTKCGEAVMNDLEESGHLLKRSMIVHSYPHDWRTKKPIIYRATPQWFASIDNLKEDLVKEIAKVKWIPKWGEIRLSNMIKDRHDWCISRQRLWGVPIPVFYTEKGNAILDGDVIRHVADIFAKEGSDSWFAKEAHELLPLGYTHVDSPNGVFTKETDIMDVWFDSGTSYLLLDREGIPFPSDIYLEGSDQFRGWFNSSLITSVALYGKAPYKCVSSHGFVLDGEDKKMSKSLGNTVDPNKVFKELGADILRLWAAGVEYNNDVRISDALLKQVAENYRKIRNTFRFMLANTSDFYPSKELVPYHKLPSVDRYILCRCQEIIKAVHEGYQNYSFLDVIKTIIPFISNDLSAFYLDFTKDILYVEQKDGWRRKSCQTVIYTVLDALVKLLTPIIPHTATEVYDFFTEKEEDDIYLTKMPLAIEYDDATELLKKWNRFMVIRDYVLKSLEEARNQKTIGKSFSADLRLVLPEDDYKLIMSLDDDVRQILIVSYLNIEVGDTIKVYVSAASGHTCARCWQTIEYLEGDLCPRCHKIVEDINE